MGEVEEPSLPGSSVPKGGAARWQRALVTLSWPLDNIGPSLPNLLATVAGNLFELKQFSDLRLLDIRLPDAFMLAYPGPAFGIAGTRQLSGVEGRPLVGTIVKPSIGLSADETAQLAGALAEAGKDFIKDDELQADAAHRPFEDRAVAVMRVLNAHAERAGWKVMFAFNLTGDLDQMRPRHDLVVAQVPGTWQALRSTDLIYAAGGSIIAHSAGPAAGVASLREAWEAAVAGVPAEDYARERPALAAALDAYG